MRRRTVALMNLALVLMAAPFDRFYGYELTKRTRIRPGVLYPILDRLLTDGWVTADWELPDEITAKKPRRYYMLTDLGRRELGAAAEAALRDPRYNVEFGWLSA